MTLIFKLLDIVYTFQLKKIMIFPHFKNKWRKSKYEKYPRQK